MARPALSTDRMPSQMSETRCSRNPPGTVVFATLHAKNAARTGDRIRTLALLRGGSSHGGEVASRSMSGTAGTACARMVYAARREGPQGGPGQGPPTGESPPSGASINLSGP